jgi:hypothetical protein
MERMMGDKWEEENSEDVAETEMVVAVEGPRRAAVRTRKRSTFITMKKKVGWFRFLSFLGRVYANHSMQNVSRARTRSR